MARKYSCSEADQRAHLREGGPVTTIVVADVSRMSCQLMVGAFEQSPYPIEVAGWAIDSLGVQRAAKEFQPDVAVISAGLKDGPKMGLKAARELWVSGSKTKAIILIDETAGAIVIEALQSGALGVIGRDESFERLCKCICVVRQGQVWINTNQMIYLIDYLVQTAPALAGRVGCSSALTKREQGVVHLVAEGMTNREISRQLNLSENTVRNYLFRIFNKLGTSTRLELALYENRRTQVHRISEGPGEFTAPIGEGSSASSPRVA